MKVTRKTDTKESAAYWRDLEKIGKEVEKMPAWMKGGESIRKPGENKNDN